MELKDKLLAQMKLRGWNGQTLARISQVSDSEISRILSGKSRPGLENASRLAKAVGVTLDFLADNALDVAPVPSSASNVGPPEERELVLIAHEFGCARAARILEIARFLGYEVAMGRLLGAKPMIEIDASG